MADLIADDLRPEMAGPAVYGQRQVITPNIDKLAASAGAVTFAKAYCQQAVCGESESVFVRLPPTYLAPPAPRTNSLLRALLDVVFSCCMLHSLMHHYMYDPDRLDGPAGLACCHCLSTLQVPRGTAFKQAGDRTTRMSWARARAPTFVSPVLTPAAALAATGSRPPGTSRPAGGLHWAEARSCLLPAACCLHADCLLPAACCRAVSFQSFFDSQSSCQPAVSNDSVQLLLATIPSEQTYYASYHWNREDVPPRGSEKL